MRSIDGRLIAVTALLLSTMLVAPWLGQAPAAPDASQAATAPRLTLERPAPATYSRVHNLLKLTDQIYSGGEPGSDAAFAELVQLGVKTVVSVDGTRPNVKSAKKHGLRYIHIPIGYDGIDDEAGLALARVVRDSEWPIYFHCHHGKHRGPSAAAIACIAAGSVDGGGAVAVLNAAGTGKEYTGLWRDVADYQPPPAHATLPDLVETAKVDSIVVAMANIDHAFDNVKLCQAAGWTTPEDHPDLVATQEALLVREGLHETARTLSTGYDEQFLIWMKEAETSAAEVESHLKANQFDSASAALDKLDQVCKRCHVQYRN